MVSRNEQLREGRLARNLEVVEQVLKQRNISRQFLDLRILYQAEIRQILVLKRLGQSSLLDSHEFHERLFRIKHPAQHNRIRKHPHQSRESKLRPARSKKSNQDVVLPGIVIQQNVVCRREQVEHVDVMSLRKLSQPGNGWPFQFEPERAPATAEAIQSRMIGWQIHNLR